MPDDLMFDPDKLPLPFPFPGPWFPKYPLRAAMSFGDFVHAINGSPAESPVWGVVKAIRATDESVFTELRTALKAQNGIEAALKSAFENAPAVADALRKGSSGDEATLSRLLHPFFLAVDWELVQTP